MKMLLTTPSPHLCDSVVGLWSLRGRPQGCYSGLPKPFVEIIVSLSGLHFWQADETSAPLAFKDGWVTPVQSGPRFAKTRGPLHLVGVRIGIDTAATLFGPVVNRDAGPPIPLGNLIGHEAALLREQLQELDSEVKRLERLGQWVEDRLADKPVLALPSVKALAAMGWRTDALAEYMDLSPRGLRKRFRSRFGIGPKFWLQLSRFDSLLSSDVNGIGLAATASAFGYTDQSHMTSDFKRFAGRPPQDYLTTRRQAMAPDAAPHFVPNSD